MRHHQTDKIHIIGALEDEIENRSEGLFEEIMAESFPNARREMRIQIH